MDFRRVTIAQGSKGLRNNNPLNVNSDNWQGEINPTPNTEAIFDDDINGLRAAALNIYNYYYLHNLTTIAEIISRWAPSNTNDTQDYINNVVNQMQGVGANDNFNLDGESLFALMRAMMNYELGEYYSALVSDDDIRAGINATGIDTLIIAGESFLFIGAIIILFILINAK